MLFMVDLSEIKGQVIYVLYLSPCKEAGWPFNVQYMDMVMFSLGLLNLTKLTKIKLESLLLWLSAAPINDLTGRISCSELSQF